ncbi:Uncharacterised protein [Mycobacterium tuberculosis]|nr:Uncharacterised protein [Mycobacterium tuberculosis]
MECALRTRPSSAVSASSTRLLVVPSVRASEWTLRRSGSSSCWLGSGGSEGGAPSITYSPQAPGRVLIDAATRGLRYLPGSLVSRACDGLVPSSS